MVSVIMPTYNRESLLSESIKSVLQQTYTNLELIIIDDGSEDNTATLVQNFKDDRILYFQLQHSGYVGRLRNIGIKQSTGNLIAFIDSDDIWKPDKLEKQVSLLTNNTQVGFCISDATLFEGGNVVMQHVYKKQNTIEIRNIFHLLKRNQFGLYPSTFIFKRECLEKTGLLNEDIRSADYNFNIRMSYYYPAIIIYEPLVLRRIHESNRHNQFPVQNYKDYVTTYEFLYSNKMIEKKYLNMARSNANFRIGDIHLKRGEKAAARKHYFTALKHKPVFPQCYSRILLSYLKS